MDYKKTLLLPRTSFEMRAKLATKEPIILEAWLSNNIYEKILFNNQNNPSFTLHDGPPYANGSIHVGHALNRILKDFVIKSKSLLGYKCEFIPGWDTHGLPIEQKVTELGINFKEISIANFRKECHRYATSQIEIQKKQMLRLGIFGRYDNPYITYQKDFESSQIEVFFKMYEQGLIFKGLKPIYWSPSSETALAEAEIIYDNKKSISVYVPFKVLVPQGKLKKNDELVIWTTTPWTLPSNSGIAVDKNITYVIALVEGKRIIVAEKMVKKLSDEWGKNLKEIDKFTGETILQTTYSHPFLKQIGKLIHSQHVDLESGTGLVHIAPPHGPEDYIVGLNNDLKIYNLIDDRGHFVSEVPIVGGMFWIKANKIIFELLKDQNFLWHHEFITHSYPHDWRTKKPVMYRATPQWFCSVEKIRPKLLEAIKKVNWVSVWGSKRLSNMMINRQDWCISRQRFWGVPIPIIYGENKKPILDPDLNKHLKKLFKEHGSNVWFDWDIKKLLPQNYQHEFSPNNMFTKETDTMDVWFDSGSSSFYVAQKYKLEWPFDLYLEGSDQYRGWFNSSLITGVSINNQAPYKQVLSHGFVLDGKGEKMSKSKGNVINPNEVVNKYGSDILRLWVASSKFQTDVRISDEILKQISEQYRSIRFKIRFALSNLSDFDISKNKPTSFTEIDKYFINKINHLNDLAKESYENYNYGTFLFEVLNFLNHLSTNYFDFTKDILYISDFNNERRRQIQSVIYYFLETFIIIMAPILSFTCEEAYKHFPKNSKKESIFLESWPEKWAIKNVDETNELVEKLLLLKKDITKEMEKQRTNNIIGKPADAKITINLKIDLKQPWNKLWNKFFMASKINIVNNNDFLGEEFPTAFIKIEKCPGTVCARCWLIFEENMMNKDICVNCHKIVKEIN